MDKRSKIITGILSLLLIFSLAINYRQLSDSGQKPEIPVQQPDSAQIKEIVKLKKDVELLKKGQEKDSVRLNKVSTGFLSDLDKISRIVEGSKMERYQKEEITKVITDSKTSLKKSGNK